MTCPTVNGRSWRTTKSFAKYTALAGGEEYMTLSMVVPIVMELSYHLTEVRIREINRTIWLHGGRVILVGLGYGLLFLGFWEPFLRYMHCADQY